MFLDQGSVGFSAVSKMVQYLLRKAPVELVVVKGHSVMQNTTGSYHFEDAAAVGRVLHIAQNCNQNPVPSMGLRLST